MANKNPVRKDVNKYIIPGSSKGRRNLTKEERRSCVEILSRNDWNYSKTQRILENEGIKISLTSLRAYRKEFEDQIENLPEKYMKKFDEKLEKRDDAVIEKTFELQELTLKRMVELVPQEKNLNNLVNVMNMLHNVMTGKETPNQAYEKAGSLIEQINEHLRKRNEQKNKSSGNIEDVTFEPVK